MSRQERDETGEREERERETFTEVNVQEAATPASPHAPAILASPPHNTSTPPQHQRPPSLAVDGTVPFTRGTRNLSVTCPCHHLSYLDARACEWCSSCATWGREVQRLVFRVQGSRVRG